MVQLHRQRVESDLATPRFALTYLQLWLESDEYLRIAAVPAGLTATGAVVNRGAATACPPPHRTVRWVVNNYKAAHHNRV